jgi:hypothetical protein
LRFRGENILTISLMGVAIWVIINSINWPLKASLFPLVISIMIIIVALIELSFGLSKNEKKEEEAIDFKLSENLDRTIQRKRTFLIFLWIIIFFFLINLFGFHLAIPIFFIIFWKLGGKEGWKISIGLAIISWLCFYFLFIWLLNIPFMEGWVIRWLKTFF